MGLFQPTYNVWGPHVLCVSRIFHCHMTTMPVTTTTSRPIVEGAIELAVAALLAGTTSVPQEGMGFSMKLSVVVHKTPITKVYDNQLTTY